MVVNGAASSAKCGLLHHADDPSLASYATVFTNQSRLLFALLFENREKGRDGMEMSGHVAAHPAGARTWETKIDMATSRGAVASC